MKQYGVGGRAKQWLSASTSVGISVGSGTSVGISVGRGTSVDISVGSPGPFSRGYRAVETTGGNYAGGGMSVD